MSLQVNAQGTGMVSERANSTRMFPVCVMDVEITRPLPAIAPDPRLPGAWILVRLHTEPIGVCRLPIGANDLTPDDLGEALWTRLGSEISRRASAAGFPLPSGIPKTGLNWTGESWPLLASRREALASAPFISVVICTRGRPDVLGKCLDKVDKIDYPHFEVVIVDNAPVNSDVELLLSNRESLVDYRYVVEPRAGLSWARNAGATAARGEVVAFLDDDAEPDVHWLAAIIDGFRRSPAIGCVTGMILPTELMTTAQELFEDLGGHSKGRDFSSAIFSRRGPQNPLYPMPAFGLAVTWRSAGKPWRR